MSLNNLFIAVCLPDGRVVVLIDTSDVFPPIHPKWTSLLNPSCRPLETNHTRALFSFTIESCGTVKIVSRPRWHSSFISDFGSRSVVWFLQI